LTLNYVGLIAPIVKVIQALAAEVTSLEATVAGFAHKFTSDEGDFGKVCAKKSDGSYVCITADQLAAVLSGQSSNQSSPSSSGPQVQISGSTPFVISGTSTPPTIDIQGNNPAIIHVGDTYTDLGAIVTDNQGHSLSFRTFVNAVLESQIVIDTSAPATDTID
jgi:hypothetical protein